MVPLLQAGFVDWIVSTGANLYHDMHRALGFELVGSTPFVDDVALRERFFKQKDVVENYLAAKVRAGEIPLEEAQRGIAADWVQYLETAKAFCRGSRC